MPRATSGIPSDYPTRVRFVRGRLELTQGQLAERIGVSFATVNRWENGQSKPTRLAWQKILDLETAMTVSAVEAEPVAATAEVRFDFIAKPEVVGAVAEATRLTYGH